MIRNPIVRHNTNPLLVTRVYEVELYYGEGQEIVVNQITESIFHKYDPDGENVLLFRHITDHNKIKYAASKDEGFIRQQNFNPDCCKTAKDWELIV